ncbi:hypothetical protein H6M51_12555 [Rhizobium sp. AQ_MP]|uniref:hypothetical protein n=1 Tax=Rhizobium sp. AQ_MP TaxID=2761536 RepID=UPI001639904E|nr:hypothetical protein [Rhizobium sp. AQ_MP]MBC2773697.1 hypothetical protein [Rhizobium sp. AQ_MP]
MTEAKELDLIWGVGAIGKEIGRSYQATYHMIQAGHLPPVRQVGQRYVASRKALIEFFHGQETAA